MKENLRINLFLFFVLLAFSLPIWRLFVLSYYQHSVYSKTAEAQKDNVQGVITRGNIYFSTKDQQPVLAATNKKFPVVFIISAKVEKDKQDEITKKLVEIIGLEEADIAKTIKSGSDLSITLPKRLDNDQVTKVKDLGYKGVGVSYEMDRYYPNNKLGSDVLGFLGYSGYKRVGQYGIESYYNNDLYGKREGTNFLQDGVFAKISSIFKKNKEKEAFKIDRPKDIVLTIDKNIQAFAEDRLEALIKKWSATGGSVIIQEPNTGKILAMADYPSFDPNSYRDFEQSIFLNSAVQQIFEPGSSFKVVTMSAGLDLNKINPNTTYEDTGSLTIAGYTIKNFSEKIFGLQTMTQVLEKSLNTGTMHIQKLVGDDNFLSYVVNMGFGQKTGIDMPGELSGDITNLYSGQKINYLTASFGQGIAVTPIQLISAFSVIANGGKLMRPYIVEKISAEGGVDQVTKPEVVGIPISAKTSAKLKAMLVSVVDNGFDKARIKGYDIAGKTGTAQIPDEKGGYTKDQFIHNFLGFAPASDPKFVIMIKMDRPQGITFAADSLSPIFREIASFLINYFGVPPSR